MQCTDTDFCDVYSATQVLVTTVTSAQSLQDRPKMLADRQRRLRQCRSSSAFALPRLSPSGSSDSRSHGSKHTNATGKSTRDDSAQRPNTASATTPAAPVATMWWPTGTVSPPATPAASARKAMNQVPSVSAFHHVDDACKPCRLFDDQCTLHLIIHAQQRMCVWTAGGSACGPSARPSGIHCARWRAEAGICGRAARAAQRHALSGCLC
jgi:hypothetical protein